jgi:hypothetical protein
MACRMTVAALKSKTSLDTPASCHLGQESRSSFGSRSADWDLSVPGSRTRAETAQKATFEMDSNCFGLAASDSAPTPVPA